MATHRRLDGSPCDVVLDYLDPPLYGCPEDRCVITTVDLGFEKCTEKNVFSFSRESL